MCLVHSGNGSFRSTSPSRQRSGVAPRGLNQAANAAVKARGSIFAVAHRRLVPRLGHAQAIVAITHRLCRLIWKILHERVRYEEREPAVSAEAKKVRARRIIHRPLPLVQVASHRHPFFLLPPLHRADTSAQVCGDFLPGIQAVLKRAANGPGVPSGRGAPFVTVFRRDLDRCAPQF
jgi:hypothetical protein